MKIKVFAKFSLNLPTRGRSRSINVGLGSAILLALNPSKLQDMRPSACRLQFFNSTNIFFVIAEFITEKIKTISAYIFLKWL
jgi:hypothetical protein